MNFLFCLSLFIPSALLSFNEELMQEGHSIYLTKNADESQEWKLRLIQEANVSLEISAGYTMGIVFEEVLNTIQEKLQTNSQIKIHLMLVEIFDFISKENFEMIVSLQTQYPDRFKVVITPGSDLVNYDNKAYLTENHIKLIIADEKYFILGGTNLVDPLSTADTSKYERFSTLASRFFPNAASDMDAIISGPMAKNLRHDFFHLYSIYTSQIPLHNGEKEIEGLQTDYFPVEEKDQACIAFFDDNSETIPSARVYATIAGPKIKLHSIGDMYEHIICKSESSIDIGNMYFFPRASIYDALIGAVNRNVALNLVTNGIHDQVSLSNASRNWYGFMNRGNYFPVMGGKKYGKWEFFEASKAKSKAVAIYELDLIDVLFHKKVITTDERYCIIGSYNLGIKSEDAAHEVACLIESPAAAIKMKKILLEDYANSRKIPFNEAMGWYFDPYYNLVNEIEKNFFDGLLL